MKLKKIINNTFISTIFSTAIIAVLGLTSGILLANKLSIIERGEYASIIVWVTSFGIIGEFGLGFALSYFVGKKPILVNCLWSIGVVFASISGLVLVLIGLVIFPLILKLNSTTLVGLFIALFSLPLSINNGFTSFLLLGLGKLNLFNSIRIITSFLNTLFVFFTLVFLKGDILLLSVFYFINQLLTFVFVQIIFHINYKPKFNWNKKVFKSVFNYGLKTYFSSISAQINFRLDQLIMSGYSNISQISIYAIAVSYSSILTPIFSAFGTIVFSKLLVINQVKPKLILTIKYILYATLLSFPFLLILFVFSKEIIVFIFSSKYLSSIMSAKILIVAIVFEGINRILGNALRAYGLPEKPAASEFMGLLSSVLFLYLLLPKYGAVGASIASLITYILIMFFQIYFIYRFYTKNHLLRING